MNHGWGNEEEVANMGELYVDYNEETLLVNITSNGEFMSKLSAQEGEDFNINNDEVDEGAKNKDNWKWFLDNLVDLQLNLGNGYTLMSCPHKGLLEATKEMLPSVEYKHCVDIFVRN
ncbi:unnamed protein product [Lactuca saligna]|uniref:Uncharacterized protein n=1 Tax=Lactuca saligna TaxID=75948 RepID=A0AA35YFH4_LACSI|nr:unnamed protein product [Lactuca saligna]